MPNPQCAVRAECTTQASALGARQVVLTNAHSFEDIYKKNQKLDVRAPARLARAAPTDPRARPCAQIPVHSVHSVHDRGRGAHGSQSFSAQCAFQCPACTTQKARRWACAPQVGECTAIAMKAHAELRAKLPPVKAVVDI